MSLRVWLPLTKDLKNQGLDDVAITNNGATFNSAGKLGGSYTGGIDVSSSVIPTVLNGSEFTVAFWIYINEVPTGSGVVDTYVMACGTSGTRTQFHIAIRQNGAGFAFCFYADDYTFYNTVTDKVGKWMHVVCAFKNNTQIVYVDGTKVGERATAGKLNVAANSVLNIYAAHERLNDVRIYDHCLSPMEVKELSKGLVLHYPLNRGGWGQENFILESHKVISGGNASGITRTYESDGSMKIVSTSGNDNYASLGFAQNSNTSVGNNMAVGDAYCISCDAKIESGTTLPTLFINSGNSYKQLKPVSGSIITGQWMRVYYTSTWADPGTNYGNISLHLGFSSAIGTYYFKNFKLEKGSIPTPWCPNAADINNMNINGTTEYDTSGYCNNGTRTGTFSWTSDTPKYQVSTSLSNNASKLHISGLSTSGFGNSYSIAWWGKTNSFSGLMQWGFSDGIRLNGIFNGNLWNTGDSANNPLYIPGTTTQVTVPTTNVWHHFVMTGDGTTCKVYKDGELWGQAKTYKAISGTSIYFNGWDSSTSYSNNNGYSMSDFRIYATALSADDVKSLYQNSAYIDSSGNVYGAVHSEV